MKILKILVVDDHRADFERAAKILRRQGHSVLAASNGYEGLRLAESEQPDLILMDVVMPELNGFQATRELSRKHETMSIPVVVISCKEEESDRAWAYRQGARAYLNKGFDGDALLAVIDSVISGTASHETGSASC